MTVMPDDLPSDLAGALAALQAERAARLQAEAAAAAWQARWSDTEALIAHLQLRVEKLKRELYGQRSERTAWLIDQLELQLEDLVAAATEDELAVADLLADTVAWARGGGPEPYPLADGCQDHLLSLAIGESIRTGGPVTTAPGPWA